MGVCGARRHADSLSLGRCRGPEPGELQGVRQSPGRPENRESGHLCAECLRVHDMHGNAREWVQDCWHASYRGAPADGSAWTAGADCKRRVLRGGSWSDIPWDIRSAGRMSGRWKDRNSKTGFRVALTLEP